jgi:hypothetical protein
VTGIQGSNRSIEEFRRQGSKAGNRPGCFLLLGFSHAPIPNSLLGWLQCEFPYLLGWPSCSPQFQAVRIHNPQRWPVTLSCIVSLSLSVSQIPISAREVLMLRAFPYLKIARSHVLSYRSHLCYGTVWTFLGRKRGRQIKSFVQAATSTKKSARGRTVHAGPPAPPILPPTKSQVYREHLRASEKTQAGETGLTG